MAGCKAKTNRRDPVYAGLLEEVEEHISRGLLREGDYLMGERCLADAYGISYMSARKGVDELVRKGMLRRVPGKGALILGRRQEAKGSALVLLPALQNSMMRRYSAGVEKALEASGARVSYFMNYGIVDVETALFRNLAKERPLGIIAYMSATAGNGAAVEEAIASGVPSVLLDRPMPGSSAPAVESDNFDGGRQAAKHLLACGYKRLAYVSPRFWCKPVLDRLEGFKLGASEGGTEALALTATLGGMSFEKDKAWIDEAIRASLASKRPPDAFFFENDWFAFYGLETLSRLGADVPGEIGVLGFDHHPMDAAKEPRLSSMSQDPELIGRTAAELLLSWSESGARPKNPPPVPVRLVPQGTTREPTNRA